MIFSVSEVISICEIFVNVCLAIWLASFIQKQQLNSRTLKDYYIKEIDKAHEEISTHLDGLENSIFPQNESKWFVSVVARINNISTTIDIRYNLDCNILVRTIIELQDLVEADLQFAANNRSNCATSLTDQTIDDIREFRSKKILMFHEIIAKINDYSKPLFFKT